MLNVIPLKVFCYESNYYDLQYSNKETKYSINFQKQHIKCGMIVCILNSYFAISTMHLIANDTQLHLSSRIEAVIT